MYIGPDDAVTGSYPHTLSPTYESCLRCIFPAHLSTSFQGINMRTSALSFLVASGAIAAARTLPRQVSSTGTYEVQTPPLDTPWTYNVGTDPWPEYPRPQLERSEWKNLNGLWTYRNASGTNAVDNPPFNQTLEQEVLIPSCLESGLSGEYACFRDMNQV
jgi:hypothetical protein